MSWKSFVDKLFPNGHEIKENENALSGTAIVKDQTVAIIGTTNHAHIGFDIAIQISGLILDVVREHPKRPILILIDTEGQRLRRRDEMLGINSAMAHLGKCVELARRNGHKIIGIVYEEALSGGFITSGLMADACYALPEAKIRVMGLPAMARITKIPLEKLTELAKKNPVYAPGPENFLNMGALNAIWTDNIDQKLVEALKENQTEDLRSKLGFERKGRLLAFKVIQDIINEKDVKH
jgi:malonate decarboxylase gamma subunit